MSARIHHLLDVSGVRIHAVEQGQGPLVLLLHGFPESWYSWRHQLEALSAAGYRAVAIDQRGYGRSSKFWKRGPTASTRWWPTPWAWCRHWARPAL